MSTETISVLLIEDSPSDVRMIREFLKKEKELTYKIDVSSRLSEGLAQMKSSLYDIVLLDLTLPDADKTESLEKVIASKTKLPIIVLTGLDDKDFALQSLKKGAQDYLVKGDIDTAILTRSILYAIERSKIDDKKEKEKPILDEKDKQILNILQDHYKISYQELSKNVKLAASTIHNRVQNLIHAGIIKEYDTVVDPFKVGYETMAILGLSVDPMKIEQVGDTLASYDEIQIVASTTGNHDMVVQVIAHDEKELWRFINEKIKPIDGIKTQLDVSSVIDIFKMTTKIKF